jgi:hypothetical protein
VVSLHRFFENSKKKTYKSSFSRQSADYEELLPKNWESDYGTQALTLNKNGM